MLLLYIAMLYYKVWMFMLLLYIVQVFMKWRRNVCYIFYITDIIKIFLYHAWIFFSSVIQTNIWHSRENVNSSNDGRIIP
jgi:hypothetical protein